MTSMDVHELIRSLPEVNFVISTSGEIIAVNPAAARMLGREISSLPGQRVADLTETPPDKVSHYLQACSRNREPIPGALSWRIRDEAVVKSRCYGNLLRPGTKETPPLLLIRCELGSTPSNKFMELNKKLAELNAAYHHLVGQSEALEAEIAQRQRTEAELRESEEKYRFLFENSRDALMTLAPPSWRFTSGNPATVGMFRAKDEEDFISRGPGDLSPERQPDGRASAEKAGEMIETAVRQGSHFFEWVHRRIDGEEFFADVLLTRIDQGGEVMLQATVRDITEQKRAEELLQESEARLRAILETVQTGMVIIDAETHTIVEVNPMAASMIGVAGEQLIGSVCHRHICPAERGKCPFTDLNMTVDNSERVLLKADGTGMPIIKSVAPITLGGRRCLVESFVDITERKRAEDTLRNSEKKYRTLIESSADAISIIDAQTGQFIDCNMAAVKLHDTGTREKFLRLTPDRLSPQCQPGGEASSDLAMYHIQKAIAEGTDVFEWTHCKSDGTPFPALVSLGGMKLGEQQLVMAIGRDLTDLKQAEAHIKQERDNFLLIFSAAPIGLMLLDENTVIVKANKTVANLVQREPTEVIGQRFGGGLGCIHSYEDPKGCGYSSSCPLCPLRNGLESVLTSGHSICGAEANPTLLFDGTQQQRWLKVHAEPIEIDGKKHVIVAMDDITERKKIEDALRVAKEEWERTFDAIADPVMILDLNYRIVKANKAMAAALSVTPGKAVGLTCYKSVHNTDVPHASCPHAQLLADGLAHTQEIDEPRLGGHFLVSAFPLRASDGTLIGSIHTARDITMRKKAEEMSEKYGYNLEQLLAVSRDITTTTDLKSLYRSFVSTARDVLAFDCSTLLLLSEDKKTLTILDTLGFPASMIGTFSLVQGQGLSTLVAQSRQPGQVEDFASETRFAVPGIVLEKNIRSALAVPMMMKDEVFGVLIGHTLERRKFDAQEISLYQQIANQAAVAIQNALTTDRLRKSEKKLQDITSSLGEGVYVIDEYGKISFMNPEAESLLGWTHEELSSMNIHDVVHNRKPDGSLLSLDDCSIHNVIVTGERYVSLDEMFIRKDGSTFPVSVISAPVFENNKTIAAVTAFRDITDLKKVQDALNRSNQLLELQATTDSLTGIFNRLKFDEMLDEEQSRSQRYNIPLSLVMFDIDHFKNINDTFGHHTGDVVLKELAAQITKSIRKHDSFARWGGEEFMILLPHTRIEPAAQFAEKWRVKIEELKIAGIAGLTCSFGVTELKADDDISSFTKRVDTAMYRAKTGGRNRVEAL